MVNYARFRRSEKQEKSRGMLIEKRVKQKVFLFNVTDVKLNHVIKKNTKRVIGYVVFFLIEIESIPITICINHYDLRSLFD